MTELGPDLPYKMMTSVLNVGAEAGVVYERLGLEKTTKSVDTGVTIAHIPV